MKYDCNQIPLYNTTVRSPQFVASMLKVMLHRNTVQYGFLFRDFHGSCDGGVAWVEGCMGGSTVFLQII